MTTLSQSLNAAADKAEARAQDAIASGNAEGAETALRSAATFRRLATNHRAKAILSGDPADDPQQIVPSSSLTAPSEIMAQRHALGMSQAELAELLDVEVPTLWRWEQGKSKPAHPGMLRWALHGLMLDRLADE